MNTLRLVELGRDFAGGKIDTYEFSEAICVERRKLYDVKNQQPGVVDCGEELFMLAEVYNPDNDRADYELDECRLQEEVRATLVKFNFL